MSTLLRVDASMRVDGSVSRAVGDSATEAWTAEHPDGTVTRRDLSASPLPSTTWALAVSAAYAPEDTWTQDQKDARALVQQLGDELIAADVVVLASPLYNFGPGQYVKTWIDLLIAHPKLGPGTQALAGKKLVLVVAEGGGYRAGTPREGWDHGTPYLQRIFVDNFGMVVDTVIADLTLADTTPAMAHLKGAAATALSAAHEDARAHGARLAA